MNIWEWVAHILTTTEAPWWSTWWTVVASAVVGGVVSYQVNKRATDRQSRIDDRRIAEAAKREDERREREAYQAQHEAWRQRTVDLLASYYLLLTDHRVTYRRLCFKLHGLHRESFETNNLDDGEYWVAYHYESQALEDNLAKIEHLFATLSLESDGNIVKLAQDALVAANNCTFGGSPKEIEERVSDLLKASAAIIALAKNDLQATHNPDSPYTSIVLDRRKQSNKHTDTKEAPTS